VQAGPCRRREPAHAHRELSQRALGGILDGRVVGVGPHEAQALVQPLERRRARDLHGGQPGEQS